MKTLFKKYIKCWKVLFDDRAFGDPFGPTALGILTAIMLVLATIAVVVGCLVACMSYPVLNWGWIYVAYCAFEEPAKILFEKLKEAEKE